jgi:hypothetical protein
VGSPDDVINEESLREVYGMDVKILTGRDGTGSDEIKFCMPVLEPASEAPAHSHGMGTSPKATERSPSDALRQLGN